LRQTSPATLAQVGSAVGWALRVLQVEAASLGELEAVLVEAMTGLEGLTEEQGGAVGAGHLVPAPAGLSSAGVAGVYSAGAIDPEKARASKFREREEVARMGKTMAQVVAERAEARGEARGRADGEARGLRRALEGLLASRFGDLEPGIAAALAAADLDTLDQWFRHALGAETLAEIGIKPLSPQGQGGRRARRRSSGPGPA
jgi:hypothetical protein